MQTIQAVGRAIELIVAAALIMSFLVRAGARERQAN
jgi:hypothetical protein